jgi:hypothetical protein
MIEPEKGAKLLQLERDHECGRRPGSMPETKRSTADLDGHVKRVYGADKK